MRQNVAVTKLAWLVGVAALLLACSSPPTPAVGDDEVVASSEALVGRWRALDSAEVLVFLGDGTTWTETSSVGGSSQSQQRGTYRLLSPGQLEMQFDGAGAKVWTVSFGNVGSRVLKLRDVTGQTRGYVDASTIPPYAPTTSTGNE